MDGLCDSDGLRETDGAEDGLDETDADGLDVTNGCNKTDEGARAGLPFLCSITTTIAIIGTFSCLANLDSLDKFFSIRILSHSRR
jgi:hypothetical protein